MPKNPLKPTAELGTVFDITLEYLEDIGVKGLILDIDNTLAAHDDPVPADGIQNWVETLKRGGVNMIILSNNSPERVKPFAELLGLPVEAKGGKPFGGGYKRAARRLGLPLSQILSAGDQIYTDILGANRLKVKSVLLRPFEAEKTLFFKFKRAMEKPFRR
jgi:HAD superfamily phosphatase (TIGR01668 family)